MNQRYTDSREQHNPEVCLNIENSQNISFADFSDERVLVKYSQYKKNGSLLSPFLPVKSPTTTSISPRLDIRRFMAIEEISSKTCPTV